MSDKKRWANLDQLLLRAFYWMDEGLQRSLRSRGGPTVTHSQSMVILTVGEGIRRPVAIADRLGISRQAVHQCLQELVKLGLIALKEDPQDRRAKIASLSPMGAPIHAEALRILRQLEDELARRIGSEHVELLRAALEQDWGDPLNLEST